MDETEKKSLFSFEEKVIERSEAVIRHYGGRDEFLLGEFEYLLRQYRRMFKQSKRLIKLSDIQQQKLNAALKELGTAKEAADSANRFKSMFLANMSHEIRTPMNAIIGLTSLALKAEISSKVREYLNTVQISAHSLLGIINDVLDFSKIEAGKLELESVDFQLESVMGYISDLFANRAANQNIDLDIHIADDVPRCLIGDPLRLGQILVNLTGNALKFTSKGKIEIHAQVCDIRSNRVTVRFSVTDTGIGISMNQVPDLFDSFTQADGSTTRTYGGTGLGLTICKLLVEMMGGAINVESRPGKGSVFSFTVPFEINLSEPMPDENEPRGVFRKETRDEIDFSWIRGARVLLVEDNAINREVAEEILNNSGLVTTTANNGRQAVDILWSSKTDDYPGFDLVLMDVQMPEVDGYDATRQIRSELKLLDLPVIAMTAHAMKGDKEKCLDSGMNDYIAKPIDPDQLVAVISRWISRAGRRLVDARPGACPGIAGPERLPDSLPGIELNEVMKRLDGNRKLLLKVMKQFVENYSRTDVEIRTALEMGDRELAGRMTHTIKGVAATFSAHDLYAKALDLEKTIRQDDPHLGDKIDDFSAALRMVIRSADRLVSFM